MPSARWLLLDPHGVLVGGPGGASAFSIFVADRLDPAADAELVLRPTALTEAPYREGVRIRAVTAARQAVADAFESTWVVVSEFGDAEAPPVRNLPGDRADGNAGEHLDGLFRRGADPVVEQPVGSAKRCR